MNRITLALLSLALAGVGCAKDQAPAGPPRTTSPPPAGKGDAHAPVQRAVDAWRGQKAIAGKYRTVYDTVLLLGQIDNDREKTMLNIMEGTFAYARPDRFRATGTQRLEYPGRGGAPAAQAETDLLYAGRSLTMTSTSSSQVPSVARVIRIGDKLFEPGESFRIRTSLRGVPFGKGEISDTIEAFAALCTFDRTATIEEGGETFTAHLCTLSAERAIDRMIAERAESLGTMIQMAQKPEMQAPFAKEQRKFTVRAILAMTFARVLIDQTGRLRGWDVGPADGIWAVSTRLTDLSDELPPRAFVLDEAMAALAVDQTPALFAQVESLRKSFDDRAAVDATKQALLDELKRQRKERSRTP